MKRRIYHAKVFPGLAQTLIIAAILLSFPLTLISAKQGPLGPADSGKLTVQAVETPKIIQSSANHQQSIQSVGHWKNRSVDWPVAVITIGGVDYTKGEALAILSKPPRGDVTIIMFSHLLAAQLNVLNGVDGRCVSNTLLAADAWMAAYGPAGSNVRARSDAWKYGEAIKDTLEDFNSGRTTCSYPGMVFVEGGNLPPDSLMGELSIDPFFIDPFEVTWAEWNRVRNWALDNGYDMGEGMACADDHPVYSISWFDALKWCNAKSEMEGLTPAYWADESHYRTGTRFPEWDNSADGYRLPSEQEWEFAARGGNQSLGFVYSGGDDPDELGWHFDNSNQGGGSECRLYVSPASHYGTDVPQYGTWPVGLMAPNELGLYDMSGNVKEWCWDADPQTPARAVRGGSWFSLPEDCAVDERRFQYPLIRGTTHGFRLAATDTRGFGENAPYVSLAIAEYVVPAAGETYQVIVSSNTTWMVGESPDWVTIWPLTGQGDGVVSLQIHENDGFERRASVSIGGATHVVIQSAARWAGMVLVAEGTLPPQSLMREKSVSTFYIDRFEVTWSEWSWVWYWALGNGYQMGSGWGCADDNPVHTVSWFDALKWCNAKSEMEGLKPVYWLNDSVFRSGTEVPVWDTAANGYRLPSEPEWEFAARGGNQSLGYEFSGGNNLNTVGWFYFNSNHSHHGEGPECELSRQLGVSPWRVWPVGQKAPNELQLYDMSGNVAEWCWDSDPRPGNTDRALRGGGWYSYYEWCRVDFPWHTQPLDRNTWYGFRIAANAE